MDDLSLIIRKYFVCNPTFQTKQLTLLQCVTLYTNTTHCVVYGTRQWSSSSSKEKGHRKNGMWIKLFPWKLFHMSKWLCVSSISHIILWEEEFPFELTSYRNESLTMSLWFKVKLFILSILLVHVSSLKNGLQCRMAEG